VQLKSAHISRRTHIHPLTLKAKGQDPFTHFSQETNGGLDFLQTVFLQNNLCEPDTPDVCLCM